MTANSPQINDDELRPRNREDSARAYESTQFMPWPQFIQQFDWHQGEHISLIGPTGYGKTTLVKHLVLGKPPIGNIRPKPSHWFWRERNFIGLSKPQKEPEGPKPFVVVLATKPKDETLEHFKGRGFVVMRRWNETPEGYPPEDFRPGIYPMYTHRILWPRAVGLGKQQQQRNTILPAIEQIFSEGGWVLLIDEGLYITDRELLNLHKEYRDFLLRARSLGNTVVTLMQRPAWIPREAYSQVRHLFMWRASDESDLDKLQGIGGLSGKRVRAIAANLKLHEVLYANTLTEQLTRTMSPE